MLRKRVVRFGYESYHTIRRMISQDYYERAHTKVSVRDLSCEVWLD